MRKIKFRAWSNKWNKMIYHGVDNYDIDVLNNTAWMESCDDEGIKLMQFIGRKDKDGADIYEWDFLQGEFKYERSNEYPVMVVEWSERSCCFELRQVNGNKLTCPINWIDGTKVIGNKFQTPKPY